MVEGTLLYKDLSYKINGILYEVQNELGHYCNEKQYGDLFENKLKLVGLNYRREFVLPKSFVSEKYGRNRVDFIIKENNNFIVIEMKVVPALSRDHYYQCQRYLTALNLDLALLVNFRPKFVRIKRILNVEKYNKLKNNLNY